MSDKFIRLHAVMSLTGLSRSSVYKQIKKGNFPKAVSLGNRSVAWIEGEVTQWVSHRIELARA